MTNTDRWPEWQSLLEPDDRLYRASSGKYPKGFIEYNHGVVLTSTSAYGQKVERMKIRLRSGWWEVHCPRCNTEVFAVPSSKLHEDNGFEDAQWGAMTHIREWHKEQQ